MPSQAQVKTLLEVVDHAYAAITDPSRWQDALCALTVLLDARAAGLRIERVSGALQQTWFGLPEEFHRAYVGHYWREDPWAGRIWTAPIGAFTHGDGVCARSVVEASAFHNELALPSGFDDLAGGILERSARRTISLGVMKGTGRRRFDASTDLVFGQLAPHLARSLALYERLHQNLPFTADAPPSPAPCLSPLEDRLRAVYALTSAEARVAIRVGQGLAPKAIAQQLGSSWNTVRAQLRQVFAKTEQRSQSALARLVTLHETEILREQALQAIPR